MTELAQGDESAARERADILRTLNRDLAGDLIVSIATDGIPRRR